MLHYRIAYNVVPDMQRRAETDLADYAEAAVGSLAPLTFTFDPKLTLPLQSEAPLRADR